MDVSVGLNQCERSEATCAHALKSLPAGEVDAAEAHIASCPDCRREFDTMRWPRPRTAWSWIGWTAIFSALFVLASVTLWVIGQGIPDAF
jgi:hypothetical protein